MRDTRRLEWLGLARAQRDGLTDFLAGDEISASRAHLSGPAPQAATGLPDLRIDDVEIEGDNIDNGEEYGPNFRAGDHVSLRWNVDNIGTASAGSSRVAVRLISDVDGMTVDTNPTSSISAGGSDTSETGSFDIPSTLSPGLYGIQLIADDRNEISESNESNNEFLILIRVDEAGRPDLVLDNIELDGNRVSASQEYSVQAGQEITITLDVDNDGDGDAGSSRLAARFIDDVRNVFATATNPTSAIDADDSDTNESLTLTIPTGLPPGLYGIQILADERNEISESNEGNNEFLILVRVSGTQPPPPGDDYRDEDTDTSSPLGSLSPASPAADGVIGLADANDTRGDKDVFKVTLTQGQTYIFTMTGATVNGAGPLAQSIFTVRSGSSFNTILATSTEGPTAQMEFYAQTGGTYYIRTGSGGVDYTTAQGGYHLTMGPADSPPGQPDPDGTIDISSIVQSTNAYSYSGQVGGGDPQDVFTLTAPAPGQLKVDLTGLTADLDLAIFNAAGGRIDHSTLNGSAAEHLSIALTAGQRVEIHIDPYGAAQSHYSLNVDFDRTETPPPATLPSSAQLIGDHLLRTLVEFANGAYDVTGPNSSATDPSESRTHLMDDGWQFFTQDNVSGTPFAGLAWSGIFYNNSPAQAVIARSSDAIVLSFRGTNWEDLGDFTHWPRMSDYYDLFLPLVNSIKLMLEKDTNIKHVYVTGHSLGASMVDAFMATHPNTASVRFEAFTFAHPGFLAVNDLVNFAHDDRITGFHNRSDPALFFDRVLDGLYPRLDNIIEYSGATISGHSSELYVYGVDFLARSGVGDYVMNLGLNGQGHNRFLIPAPGGGIDNTLASTTGARLMVGGSGNDNYDVGAQPVFAGDTIIESGGANDWLRLRSGNGSLFQGTARLALGGNGVDLIVYPVVTIAGISTNLNAIRIYNHFTENGRVEFIQWNGYFTGLPSKPGDIDGWNGIHYKRVSLADIQYTEAPDGSISGSISASGGGGALDTVSFGGLRNSVTASLLDGVASILDGLLPPGQAPGGAAFATAAAATASAVPVDISNMENVTGSSVADNLTGNNAANYLEGGDGDDLLFGLSGNDMLDGGEGADRLNGGVGADAMIGGAADDWFYVDNAGDQVFETAGQGNDRIFASLSYTLTAGAEVELMTTSNNAGATAINLTGNELANSIFGNAGANILDGKAGADTLAGFGGNDLYYVDNAGDRVVEGASEGAADRIFASISYTLGTGVYAETLSTTNNAGTAAIHLTGNELANTIIGNAGANALDGKAGADAMAGFAGNDFYYVDNAADRVVENAGEGSDRVVASASYALGPGVSVEGLVTLSNTAATAINLTGNALAQSIVGNAGANWLDSGGGGDIMVGLGGDDFYFVRAAGDRAVEAAGGGNDRVFAATSFTLEAGSAVEVLSTISNAATTAINLTGNELANTILGNAGANILDGKAGADAMAGFGGNDFYYVDNRADRIVEGAGEGTADRVFASMSYGLGAGVQVEMLTTSNHAGTTAIDLAGNELANSIFGNAGANILDGKAGADALAGFGGADSFAFTTALGGGNVDRIVDFVSGSDRILLDKTVFAALGGPGALNANAFALGTAAAEASDRIIYNQATGQLFYDADGNGVGAAVLFATLDGKPAITAGDFMVI